MITPHSNIIKTWLYCVAALIFAMVIVGGATRLTGSGLSITEWKPILGAIPPLNHEQWMDAFNKYRAIPQYQLINKGMSLEAFQFIFWWEWGHRFLGRIIGVAFAIPFVFFLIRGWLSKPLFWRCVGLLALGGLQGFMGWYMVQSGLSERVSVSHFRLAAHLTLACVIFALILWTAWGVCHPERSAAKSKDLVAVSLRPIPRDPSAPLRCARDDAWANLLLFLIFLQIIWGGFVAGSHAGFIYNTWPLMDGALIPDSLFDRKFLHDQMPIQFMHRVLAILLFATSAYAAWKLKSKISIALFAAISVQAIMGILTLIHVTPLHLALAHQGFAMVVIALAVRLRFEAWG